MDPTMQRVARGATVVVCCLASVSIGARAQATATAASNPAVDPKAIKALTDMGNYMRQQQKFKIDMKSSKDQVLPNGMKVTFDGTVDYEVSRPNKMHATLKTDRKEREVYYDGNTLTLYAPRMKYYAQAPAPGTIKATMDAAAKKYGLEFPLGDLFTWGSDPSLVNNLQFAAYIGPAEIDGVRTDQYVFRQPDADWQLWIEHGDKPLPKKFVITTTSEPGDPTYTATMKWDLSPNIPETAYNFSPPADAKKIKLTEANVRVARTKP